MPPCKDCCGHLQTISVLETRLFHLEERDTLPWTPQVRIPESTLEARLTLAEATLALIVDGSVNTTWDELGARPKQRKRVPREIVVPDAAESADVYPEISTATGWPSLITANVANIASLPSQQQARSSTPRHTERTRRVRIKSPQPLMALQLSNRFLPLSHQPCSPSERHAPVPAPCSEGRDGRPRSRGLQLERRPRGRARMPAKERRGRARIPEQGPRRDRGPDSPPHRSERRSPGHPRGPESLPGRQQPAPEHTEPDTLIIGDSAIKNISGKAFLTYSVVGATVCDINGKIPEILSDHPKINKIIVHVGTNDIRREQSELLKKDFIDLFNTIGKLEITPFISGPLPTTDKGVNKFSRLLGLNTWLNTICNLRGLNFIDNFNLFWGRKHALRADGLHPSRSGVKLLLDNFLYCRHYPSVPCRDQHQGQAADLATVTVHPASHNIQITLSSTEAGDVPPSLDGLAVSMDDAMDDIATSDVTPSPAPESLMDDMDDVSPAPESLSDDSPAMDAMDDIATPDVTPSPAPESLSEADDSPAMDAKDSPAMDAKDDISTSDVTPSPPTDDIPPSVATAPPSDDVPPPSDDVPPPSPPVAILDMPVVHLSDLDFVDDVPPSDIIPSATDDIHPSAVADDITSYRPPAVTYSPSSSGSSPSTYLSSPMSSPRPFTPRMMELVRKGVKFASPKSLPPSPPQPRPPRPPPPKFPPQSPETPLSQLLPPQLFPPQSPETPLSQLFPPQLFPPQSPETPLSQFPPQFPETSLPQPFPPQFPWTSLPPGMSLPPEVWGTPLPQFPGQDMYPPTSRF